MSPPILRLELLGGLRAVRGDDQEIGPIGKKPRALLAYLALNSDREHAREKLATIFWGARAEEQARHSLRQSISVLRKVLNDQDGVLLASGLDSLVLKGEAVQVDVADFEKLARYDTNDALERAVALYRGPLLDGLTIRAEEYENWVSAERARLHEIACGVLERLMNGYTDSGEAAAAIRAGQQLLNLDPVREEAHRALMALYRTTGRRSAALKQYQLCVETLRRELDVSPGVETTGLYESIRNQEDDTGEQAVVTEPETLDPGIAPAFPDRPSIAVLPFGNLSNDADQDYFADGIAENIITSLGKFRWLFVISRNSTFFYKGAKINLKQLSKDLGVRYVLEGNVRTFGQKVRVSVGLIDAKEERQIWSEAYDREISDIFAIQDDITQNVLVSLAPQLVAAEAERVRKQNPQSMDVWDHVMRARWHLWKFRKEDCEKAKHYLDAALELDENNVAALTDLAVMHAMNALFGWGDSTEESLAVAHQNARRAVAEERDDAWAHAVLGIVSALLKRYDDAVRSLQRALQIYPNFAIAYGLLGYTYAFKGESSKSVETINLALRLSPHDPFAVMWYIALGGVAFAEGRYHDAIEFANKAIEENPDWPSSYRILAASFGQLGYRQDAENALREVLRLMPGQTVGKLASQYPFADSTVVDRFLDGMRKAGLPE